MLTKSSWLHVLLVLVAMSGLSGRSYAQTRDNISYCSAVEQEVVRLTNEQRHLYGLPDLIAQPTLVDVARSHSVEMITHDYFEHTSPTPGFTHPWDRVFRMGIKTMQVSENIFSADGYRIEEVAREALGDWMSSKEGHRENILNPASAFVGVGAALHPSSNGRGVEVLVTQEFTGPILAQR